MQQYDLSTQYDARASFYGKARVEVADDGTKRLYSYGTHVASILPGRNTPLVLGYYSQTTQRHIKEFLKQNGFRAENSKQIWAEYGEGAQNV